MQKIKVTAVSYLNTKPFLYGIFNSDIQHSLDIRLDIPSECARKLETGEADLGLVPVAAIPRLSNPIIVSDYCIGAVGKVKTVAIFSEVPIHEVTHLYLDHHSKTSINLAKILLKEYWQCQAILLEAKDGYIEQLKGTTAGVVIGDRTIGLEEKFPYVYDLSTAWYEYTSLPFVFAAWVSRRPLSPSFIQSFNFALQKGLECIPQLTYILQKPHPDFDLQKYFSQYISYHLDDAKRKALSLFLEKMNPTTKKLEQPLQFC